MIEIELNTSEQKLAEYHAKARYSNNRISGVTNNKIGSQSNEYTDLNGIGAELAFCKMFNLYPDLGMIHSKFDSICHNGTTVDVKVTKYKSGKLLAVTSKKLSDCDVYVLVIGEFPIYKIVGFATAEELLNKENITDLGYGETFKLEQKQLNINFDELTINEFPEK